METERSRCYCSQTHSTDWCLGRRRLSAWASCNYRCRKMHRCRSMYQESHTKNHRSLCREWWRAGGESQSQSFRQEVAQTRCRRTTMTPVARGGDASRASLKATPSVLQQDALIRMHFCAFCPASKHTHVALLGAATCSSSHAAWDTCTQAIAHARKAAAPQSPAGSMGTRWVVCTAHGTKRWHTLRAVHSCRPTHDERAGKGAKAARTARCKMHGKMHGGSSATAGALLFAAGGNF